jgi:ferredoxin
MKVKITEDCIACEKCVEICPEVFEMGDEYAEVKTDEILPEFEDAVRQSAQECPVASIIIEE